MIHDHNMGVINKIISSNARTKRTRSRDKTMGQFAWNCVLGNSKNVFLKVTKIEDRKDKDEKTWGWGDFKDSLGSSSPQENQPQP